MSGALVLLFSNLTKKRSEKIVEEERQKAICANSKKEAVNKFADEMRSRYIIKYTDMFRNIFAFGYLSVGYLLSIWAANEYNNKSIIAVSVIFLCGGLCILAEMVSKKWGIREAEKRDYSRLPEGCIWYELEDDKEQVYKEIIEKECDIAIEGEAEEKEKIKKTDEKSDIKKHLQNWVAIISILTTLYVIVNETGNMIYKNACEEFFQIPQKFFVTDFKFEIIYLIVSILVIMFIAYPAIARSIIERGKKENKKSVAIFWGVVSVICGVLYGEVNVINAHDIVIIWELVERYKNFDIICDWILFVFGIISVCGITFSCELLKEGKWKKYRRLFYNICMFAAITTIGLYFVKVEYNLNHRSVQNKRKYEFVVGSEKDYVVLSEKDDTILVVEYSIDNEGKYIFYTGTYQFLERSKYGYRYVDIGSEPKRVVDANPKKEDEVFLDVEEKGEKPK